MNRLISFLSLIDFNLFLLFVKKVNDHHHRLTSDSNERTPVVYSVTDQPQVKQLNSPHE